MGLTSITHIDAWKSRLKQPAFLGSLIALIATHFGMLLYGGGNPLNDGARYSFTENFLSDLGLFTTYNSQIQPFVVISFGIGLWAAAWSIWAWYKESCTGYARYAVLLAVVSLIAVPLLPSDIFLWPHRFAVIGALSGFALCNAIVIRVHGFSPYIAILTLFQLSYLSFIFLGPLPIDARVLHVVLQKVAIYSQLFLLMTNLPNKKLPAGGS